MALNRFWLLFVIAVFSAPLHAAERLTCSEWSVSNEQNEKAKIIYLIGYLDGVAWTANAASVRFTGPQKGQPEKAVTQEIMQRVWPKKLNIESVKIQIDDSCRKRDDKKISIPEVLFNIAIEANKRSQ